MWTWLVTGITWVAIMCNVYINVRWQRRLQGREKEAKRHRQENQVLRMNVAAAEGCVRHMDKLYEELYTKYAKLKKYEPNTEWVGDEKVKDFL